MHIYVPYIYIYTYLSIYLSTSMCITMSSADARWLSFSASFTLSQHRYPETKVFAELCVL